MENESYYWDLTAKYLNGKATSEEQEELQEWRARDNEHEARFKAQEKLWAVTEYKPEREADTGKAWARTEGLLQAKIDSRRPVRILYSALKVAAMLAIVGTFIWLFKGPGSPFNGTELVKAGAEKIEIVLPDSSHVWLNKGSELAYDKNLEGDERVVRLKGEGYFEVRRDVRRPFIIQTGKVRTTVLGTSFNLRAYPDDDQVELVVATGKVAFRADGGKDEAIVTPGNGASIHKASGLLNRYAVGGENAWSWRSGKLQFEDDPLREVISDLSRHYGVKLELQNSNLQACRFTGTFTNARLEEVLRVLQASLDITFKNSGAQSIIISGQGCN